MEEQKNKNAYLKIDNAKLAEYIKKVDFIEGANATMPNTPLLTDIIKIFSCDDVKKISPSLPEKRFNEYNIIATEPEKMVVLISAGKIQYNVNDFNLIYQKQEILNAYLIKNEEQILCDFDKFYNKILPAVASRTLNDKKIAQQIVAKVLDCKGIDNIKKKVFSKCSSYLFINGDEEIYKKCIIEEKIDVPYNILKQFATATAISVEEKIKILIISLIDIESKLQQSQVTEFIGLCDKSYLEIFSADYNLNADNNALRRDLYQILNSKNLLRVA